MILLQSPREELCFLRSAHCLMLIDIYMKFREGSLKQFSSYTADMISGQSPREINQKSINIRVMVLALCMSSNVFVCVEGLRPSRASQPNGVMSSAVSLPNHTFTGQA